MNPEIERTLTMTAEVAGWLAARGPWFSTRFHGSFSPCSRAHLTPMLVILESWKHSKAPERLRLWDVFPDVMMLYRSANVLRNGRLLTCRHFGARE